jgi:pimeloyl-ACP methyl ester carboxylesterase
MGFHMSSTSAAVATSKEKSTIVPKNTLAEPSAVRRLAMQAMRMLSYFAPQRVAALALTRFLTPADSSKHRALADVAVDAVHESLNVERADLPAMRIQIYRFGPANQPYVLCSHGWSSFGMRFRPWVEHLQRQGFTVLCFDHVGHGRSAGQLSSLRYFVRAIEAITAHYGTPSVMLGHSLGAAAVVMAAARGVKSDRLIAIAPPADIVPAMQRAIARMKFNPAIVMKMATQLSAGIDPLSDYTAIHAAPAVSMPLLVVHDVADTEVPWQEGASLVRLCRHARLLSTSDLGHSKIVNDPTVIDAGIAFLRGQVIGEKLLESAGLAM